MTTRTKSKRNLTPKTSTIPFHHTADGCIDDGKACRFFATKTFGTQGYCLLFGCKVHTDSIEDGGVTLRCKLCIDEFG